MASQPRRSQPWASCRSAKASPRWHTCASPKGSHTMPIKDDQGLAKRKGPRKAWVRETRVLGSPPASACPSPGSKRKRPHQKQGRGQQRLTVPPRAPSGWPHGRRRPQSLEHGPVFGPSPRPTSAAGVGLRGSLPLSSRPPARPSLCCWGSCRPQRLTAQPPNPQSLWLLMFRAFGISLCSPRQGPRRKEDRQREAGTGSLQPPQMTDWGAVENFN